MNSSDKAIADFLAKGGEVKLIKEGITSRDNTYGSLKGCQCGCEGNYTDHQMRKGERGIYN